MVKGPADEEMAKFIINKLRLLKLGLTMLTVPDWHVNQVLVMLNFNLSRFAAELEQMQIKQTMSISLPPYSQKNKDF